MAPNRQYLRHLSQILTKSGTCSTYPSTDEGELGIFFKSIASRRIRIDPYDWQGHRMDAMLWHLQDLRPAAQRAVTHYVLDRWEAFRDDISARPPEEKTVNAPSAAAAPATEPQRPSTDAGKETAGGSPYHGLTPCEHGRRRDWFDGLTDWVAGILSLLKS